MAVTAVYEIPKSTSKKKVKLMQEGLERPCKKPDIDNIAKVVCEQVESIKAVPILKTKIRLSTTVAETPAVRKTLFQYKPNNKAAVDYEKLAKEVMELYELKEIANGCG